jgi:hypothetical protein
VRISCSCSLVLRLSRLRLPGCAAAVDRTFEAQAFDEVRLSSIRRTCEILHLELGPLDLTLLGLEVVLDNCDGGPVVVDISGQRGRGNLLGNLLCGLLGSERAGIGSTLADILSQL